MQPTTLDHIALWVAERDAISSRLCESFDVHVIERTDAFTLLGPTATDGKLTLFDPPTNVRPEPDRLVSVTLADDANREPMQITDQLLISFAARRSARRHSLIGATLRSADPTIAAAKYVASFGFSAQSAHPDVATVTVGEAVITLVREAVKPVAQGVLNHLGLLVQSADDCLSNAHELGLHVSRVVDAKNTKAVFVEGPEAIAIEYVEHKPEFALR